MESNGKIQLKQVCSISITFPIETDDAALVIKKKIDEAMKETTDARVDFRIIKMPVPPTPLR